MKRGKCQFSYTVQRVLTSLITVSSRKRLQKRNQRQRKGKRNMHAEQL